MLAPPFDQAIPACLNAGMPVQAVRLALMALDRDNSAGACVALRNVFAAYSQRAWQGAEVRRANTLIDGSAHSRTATQWMCDRSVTSEEPENGPSTPGVTLALTAGEGFLERVGVPVALQAEREPWGGRIWLDQTGLTEETQRAFWQGARAGINRAIRAGGGGSIVRHIVANNCKVTGRFPELGFQVEGASIGLAAAVAVLSSLGETPVPLRTGFSGQVLDASGRLGTIGSVDVKILGAADAGLDRVLLPLTNRTEALVRLAADAGVVVEWVGSLENALDCLDFVHCQRAAAEWLDRQTLSAESLRRSWLKAEPSQEATGRRVLLTPIGSSDPFSRRGTGALVEIEGPALSLCRDLQPDEVYCLYTTSPKNDFTPNFERFRELLASPGQDVQVIGHGLLAADPTDVEALYPEFSDVVLGLVHRGDRLFANVASGTPAMTVCWHLLAEVCGSLRERSLRLLQVRDPRYVERGEAQVREVFNPTV